MTRIAMIIARLGCALATVGAAQAETPVSQRATTYVERAAHALFPDLPLVERVADVRAQCGADGGVSGIAAYCTTQNVIFLRDVAEEPAFWAHHLAHLYGHAVQVRHGVADVALREIRLRRDEEAKLRGWVTRQVECIAGFIHARAELEGVALGDFYADEPLTDSHWGRDPLAAGPKVSIGFGARAEWFAIGRAGDLSKCAPGEFGAELLLEALR